MTTYRILSIACFLIIIGGVVYSVRAASHIWSGFWKWLTRQWNETMAALSNLRQLHFSDTINVLQKFLYLITLICVVLLMLSGFIPVIFAGAHLSGFLLVLHATVSPIFAVSIALLVLISAHSHRFDDRDWEALNTLFTREQSNTENRARLGQKICYWLLVMFAIPVITSILFSMYPIFGTEGQVLLLQLHRYSTLLFIIIGVIYSYLIVIAHRTGEEGTL